MNLAVWLQRAFGRRFVLLFGAGFGFIGSGQEAWPTPADRSIAGELALRALVQVSERVALQIEGPIFEVMDLYGTRLTEVAWGPDLTLRWAASRRWDLSFNLGCGGQGLGFGQPSFRTVFGGLAATVRR